MFEKYSYEPKSSSTTTVVPHVTVTTETKVQSEKTDQKINGHWVYEDVEYTRNVTTTTTDTTGGWVGKTAPGFSLPDTDGKMVDVGKILGTKPVVLVFYRGNW